MCKSVLHTDLLSLIQQLESTVSQVSKALCGKENATRNELLQAVDQLKSRLAQVERERDALMAYVPHNCWSCKKEDQRDDCQRPCNWQWRGPCPENTKEDEP